MPPGHFSMIFTVVPLSTSPAVSFLSLTLSGGNKSATIHLESRFGSLTVSSVVSPLVLSAFAAHLHCKLLSVVPCVLVHQWQRSIWQDSSCVISCKIHNVNVSESSLKILYLEIHTQRARFYCREKQPSCVSVPFWLMVTSLPPPCKCSRRPFLERCGISR